MSDYISREAAVAAAESWGKQFAGGGKTQTEVAG